MNAAKRRRRRERTSTGLLHAGLIVGVVISCLPLLWTITSAFKSASEIFAFPPSLLPHHLTLSNFSQLFSQTDILRWMLNSIGVSAVATALGVLVSALAGFAFAKYEFAGKDALFNFVILALIVPFIALVIPLFVIVSKAKLVNTYAGVILPQVAQPFGIFLMRQFIAQTIPDDFLHAARMDGASEFRIFWRIVVPLVRPALGALAVWLFLASYNNLLWPLMVLTDASHQTLPVGLAGLASSEQIKYGLIMAGAVAAALPMLVVFIGVRRQFVRSLTRGALAG